jgi:hypothetical protein
MSPASSLLFISALSLLMLSFALSMGDHTYAILDSEKNAGELINKGLQLAEGKEAFLTLSNLTLHNCRI